MHGKARNRTLHTALIISALFHASMVTLFSIVIFFPKPRIEYYNFDIVQVAADQGQEGALNAAADAPEEGRQLRVPLLQDLPQPRQEPLAVYAQALPPIQLPTLEFGELKRLRVRSEGLDSPALDQLLGRREDSWSRLGEGIARMRESLTELRLGNGEELARPAPRPVHRPAEGYEAFIEWNSAPHDRQLLFAPPIQDLWETDPSTLKRPIEVIFEVTPQGRVINAYSLRLDESGVLDAVQLAVLKYKFEPLPADAESNQLATLYITAAGNQS